MVSEASDGKTGADAENVTTNDKAGDFGTDATELTEVSTGAVELTSDTPRHSFISRLYTGTGAFEVVGRRRMWFGISGAIVAVAILSIILRGFTFGIDFKGGTTVSMPAASGTSTVQTAQVSDVFKKTLGSDPESVVIVGSGASATVQISSETLSNDQTTKLRNALFDAFEPKGNDGKPSKQAISDSAVSETWGDQITKKALLALVVFLVLVALYITVRYERYMAISALAAMCFVVTVTAGVYSLVGFEVSPATVIGLLTILGFSLYDTVIVFDKVEENTHGFQHTTRRTFAEQANLAVNQTFMRSINTSLISVIPVMSLMVVAVWLLGVGTLKDLALVQLGRSEQAAAVATLGRVTDPYVVISIEADKRFERIRGELESRLNVAEIARWSIESAAHRVRRNPDRLLPLIDDLSKLHTFAEVIPVSAKKGPMPIFQASTSPPTGLEAVCCP